MLSFFFHSLAPSGKFLDRRKVKSAEDPSRFIEAEDFGVGAQISINSHLFKVYSADDYTIKFMEVNGVSFLDVKKKKLQNESKTRSHLLAHISTCVHAHKKTAHSQSIP